MFQQKANVANQMSPAVLGLDVEVPREGAVGRKVVEVNKTFVVRADQLFEYRPRAACCDVKQREKRCGDTPDPVLLAVVFET